MVLIYGAAYAGKRDTARKYYGISDFADGAEAPFTAVLTAPAVTNYHTLVRRLTDAGEAPEDFTRRLITEDPGAVVITDDIGSGIVPMEREERLWREQCGICMRLLAESAETVIRVVCGIPQVLKGELP
jgi:adenosylcobinamide kinase/adenosylcobinamide-phosphate guanylyltransferase